jgi:hypothetical protein
MNFGLPLIVCRGEPNMVENWWIRQLFESMMEASKRYDNFQNALELDVDDLDAACKLHQDCCNVYDEFNKMSFEAFVEIGKSLRSRKAKLNIRTHHEF